MMMPCCQSRQRTHPTSIQTPSTMFLMVSALSPFSVYVSFFVFLVLNLTECSFADCRASQLIYYTWLCEGWYSWLSNPFHDSSPCGPKSIMCFLLISCSQGCPVVLLRWSSWGGPLVLLRWWVQWLIGFGWGFSQYGCEFTGNCLSILG